MAMGSQLRLGCLWSLSVVGLAVVSGCGGGGTSGSTTAAISPPVSCDVDSQNAWLRSYMQDAYFWTGQSPDPSPSGFSTLSAYFTKLLFLGGGTVPQDRWSYISETAAYNQFFDQGRSLGYGLAVNGLEGQLPLKVRYVEMQSPAAAAGIVRGDLILSINGVPSAQLLSSADFSALSPTKEGETVSVEVANATGSKVVSLGAATYTLTPVSGHRILTLANGSKAGYVLLKDFITQSENPLANAFNDFRANGVADIILDLRYNGGGRISTANVLASLLAGNSQDGKVFTRLIYSAPKASRNTSYAFSSTATGFNRVVVLTGQRTCSASELLVNGLRPYVQVITIGGQTCGKPFGFNPVDLCGNTISAVNFEAVNALGQGRYYNGIAPTCAVEEDFSGVLGDPGEKLTAAATDYIRTGNCAAAISPNSSQRRAARALVDGLTHTLEPGGITGMRGD